jgi:hypothetical protein
MEEDRLSAVLCTKNSPAFGTQSNDESITTGEAIRWKAAGEGGGKRILHRFSGQRVSDILKQKRGSIKQAHLPSGSPSWDEFSEMSWEQIEEGAAANRPGFKVVRKLLTDRRFDR